MIVSYESLSPQARVWIYQADRLFTDNEVVEVQTLLDKFVQQWTAHGEVVRGHAQIRHHAFVIIMADSFVSGCSIDSSVKVLKNIEQQYSLRLFNRLQIAYQLPAQAVQIVSRDAFEALLAKGVMTDDTRVFNNLVANKAEFESAWQIPLIDSVYYALI